MVPPMKFFFTLWYPKGSKKNWPKCHSGQSVSGQSVTLAKVSLWPKCHSGQNVTLAKVSLAKLSLRPNCLWPKCLWPKGHSGQTVNLAKVSRPKCLWPKCHSGRSVIQPYFELVPNFFVNQRPVPVILSKYFWVFRRIFTMKSNGFEFARQTSERIGWLFR